MQWVQCAVLRYVRTARSVQLCKLKFPQNSVQYVHWYARISACGVPRAYIWCAAVSYNRCSEHSVQFQVCAIKFARYSVQYVQCMLEYQSVVCLKLTFGAPPDHWHFPNLAKSLLSLFGRLFWPYFVSMFLSDFLPFCSVFLVFLSVCL